MKAFGSKLLAGAALALALSTAANAAVTIASSTAGPDSSTLPTGFKMVYDYDNAPAAGYSQVGGRTAQPPLDPGVSAPPVGTAAGTNYGFVKAGETATLYTPLIKAFSVYIGSIDDHNYISFYRDDQLLGWFGGNSLASPASGDQFGGDTNRRFVFDFEGASANRVVFYAAGNSMEWDSIAAPISGVPEPATWAMMISGFGLMGAALRRRRLQLSPASA